MFIIERAPPSTCGRGRMTTRRQHGADAVGSRLLIAQSLPGLGPRRGYSGLDGAAGRPSLPASRRQADSRDTACGHASPAAAIGCSHRGRAVICRHLQCRAAHRPDVTRGRSDPSGAVAGSVQRARGVLRREDVIPGSSVSTTTFWPRAASRAGADATP